MLRGDLSNCLVHLTRGENDATAAGAFLSIIRSKELRGSSRDIRGGYNCVCFSEAPISVLAQVLALPAAHGIRYAPFGVMVRKDWLFAQGGRPVIYQPESEYELLHEEQRFRHVRYDPTGAKDYSWEREWRVRADSLPLDPREVTFVVPTRKWEERFLEEYAGTLRGQVMFFGEDAAFGMPRSPWHFVVLEDLGMRFTDVSLVDTVDRENVLGEINSDVENGHDFPFRVS